MESDRAMNQQCELSLLVVSPMLFGQPLSKALHKENLKKGSSYKLHIHNCQSIQEVPAFLPNMTIDESKKNFKFDYIVLVVESRLRDGLLRAEEEISHIPNYYFSCSRIFFVSGGTSMTDHSIWGLRRKYKCPALVGNILELGNCNNLARRILKLMEFTSGIKTGIPFIMSTIRCETGAEPSSLMQ